MAPPLAAIVYIIVQAFQVPSNPRAPFFAFPPAFPHPLRRPLTQAIHWSPCGNLINLPHVGKKNGNKTIGTLRKEICKILLDLLKFLKSLKKFFLIICIT